MPIPDLMVKTGDQAIFNPSFPPAVVTVAPGIITGTGGSMVAGTLACVLGDEKSVVVPGCMYISPPFVIPGVGTLTISALAPDQIATKTNFMGKPAILRGTLFTAQFAVNLPAGQPTTGPPIPDPRPIYIGNGQFVTTNVKSAGS